MGVYQFVDGRLVMLAASRGFSEMYGQTPAQRLKEAGTGLFRYIHPDDLAYIQNQLLAFASGKAAATVNQVVAKPDSQELQPAGEGARAAAVHAQDNNELL